MDVSLSPLVSIIITNYNREKTIAAAIESALAQDYTNLEIIISDNCSTDNSVNVIKRYIDDPRIRFFQNEKNIGMSENFRISIEERAKGFFFTTVNSDDKLIFKSFISESVKLTQKYNEVVLVKTGCVLRKGNSSKVKSHNNYKEYLSGFDFIKLYNFNEDFGWGGYLIDLNKFKDFNFFSSKVVGLDYFINLNLITKGNLCFLKETCYEFNIHETNESKLCLGISEGFID
jgi:glycosyltransferase involved in cell wall biosynthesis